MRIDRHYRQATSEETTFYQHQLYPIQDRVFSLCSAYQDLYLTGGTALARYYFQHRWSDDIDLFIRINKNDSDDLINLKKRADFYAKDLAGKLGRDFTISREMYGDYYARFFVSVDEVELKIDFVREYNHFGELQQTSESCWLNNLEDIGASKIAAFEDRATIKDIIDLYYLSQHVSWNRLFELADTKRVPVAYENLLTFNIEGITGQALITKPLPSEQLTIFIDELKREVEAEVKKKRTS
ncbi:nucleotidyl transferase AbiEii/AbiGii toxin family protein [Anaerolineales bacterium HSG24]|nr:nucleotidyl transferase AbiEii/AbiGii toxin family protein [Anaerolineales bacterium HSG24]